MSSLFIRENQMQKSRSTSLVRSSSVEFDERTNARQITWKEKLLDNLLLFGATPKGNYK
jgi:hypothetical protein